jgi:hypothetical protein
MALQLPTTFSTGLSAIAAVHKVLEAQFVGPTTIKLVLGVYADLSKSQDGITPFIERRFYTMTDFDPTNDQNMHTQVYDWLKTLPEYAGAVDV